jgi:hypothetical protein
MQNLYGKKLTLSLSQRKDTCFFFLPSNKSIGFLLPPFFSMLLRKAFYRVYQNVSERHTLLIAIFKAYEERQMMTLIKINIR